MWVQIPAVSTEFLRIIHENSPQSQSLDITTQSSWNLERLWKWFIGSIFNQLFLFLILSLTTTIKILLFQNQRLLNLKILKSFSIICHLLIQLSKLIKKHYSILVQKVLVQLPNILKLLWVKLVKLWIIIIKLVLLQVLMIAP